MNDDNKNQDKPKYADFPFIIASTLKTLDERKSEITDSLQNMARSDKLFESHYFRNKLKGTLEDTNQAIQKAAKLIRDLSIGKEETDQNMKKFERKIEDLEEELIQQKRQTQEYFKLCENR